MQQEKSQQTTSAAAPSTSGHTPEIQVPPQSEQTPETQVPQRTILKITQALEHCTDFQLRFIQQLDRMTSLLEKITDIFDKRLDHIQKALDKMDTSK